MKRLSNALLIPVALLLGSGEARADATADEKSFELFGKTLCLADAPADTRCDWRLPVQRPETPTYLAGSSMGDPQTAPPLPRVLKLFGFHVCFGDVEETTRCDVRYPPRPSADRQASL